MFGQYAIPSSLRLALLASAIISGSMTLPLPAQAQEDEDVVIVTGSRLRQVEREGPSPIVTITAEDIDNRGYNTVLEAINDLPQNAGGGLDQQFTFGFTPSASAVDLRGFGIGRSLVLIDGRRVPVFPLAASGTDNFVDLSSIPVAAIERIEVVTDGASAIYGSDAIGGVINIILKKTTEDELTLRRSDTTGGGGGQDRVQFATGIEGADGSQALFFAEYFDQEKMMFADREFSRSDRLGGIDGAGPGGFSGFGDPGSFRSSATGGLLVAAPNCSTSNGSPGIDASGVCRFNRAQFRELLPEMEHFSITGKFNKPIADNLGFFTRATYFTSNVKTQIEPVPADTTDVPAGNPNNPAGVTGFFVHRTVEFGPRTEDVDNNTYSVVAGFNGKFGSDYNWELGAQYSEQRITSILSGYMRTAGLDQAVTTGLFDTDGDDVTDPINLFDPVPQEVIDAIRAQPRTDGLSSIAGLDFQLNGELFDMPKGAVQFAVVTEFAKQRFSDERDPDVLAGNVEGLGGTSGGGDRKYSAFGVEFGVPILDKLMLNLAGRYDRYDDDSSVGSAVSPRIALQYRPSETLMFRASAGESFRAPDLQRLFGAATTAFTDLIDTPQCIADGGTGRGIPIDDGDDTNFDPCLEPIQSTEIHTGSNLDLVEEEGENVNFGIVWEAIPGFTVTTDFWYAKLENIVNTPEEQFILDSNAADGSFADAITRDSVGCQVEINPGCLDIVSSQARNLSFQRARGVDAKLQYLLNMQGAGQFTFRTGVTYTDKLEIREFPSEPTVDVLADGLLGEFVRTKGNASVSWERGPWNSTIFANYVGRFTPDDPTTVSKVDSYTTVNISGSYAFDWNGTLQAGINNVLDEDPPLDLSDGDVGQPFYNQFFHDPLGMTWWLNYSQRF